MREVLTLPSVPQQVVAKYEYAEQVDVRCPVDDFHKRIPQMAYQVTWPQHSHFLLSVSVSHCTAVVTVTADKPLLPNASMDGQSASTLIQLACFHVDCSVWQPPEAKSCEGCLVEFDIKFCLLFTVAL